MCPALLNLSFTGFADADLVAIVANLETDA
jgi:hypothetical protein